MKKIVLLCGKGNSSLYMYNGLIKEFFISAVIQENPVSAKLLLKRRLRNLGFLTVLGQIVFQIFIPRILKLISDKRIRYLKDTYKLSLEPFDPGHLFNVSSVNSNECLGIIQKINPDIIVVNGTRIIGEKFLNFSKAIIINTHVGITPQYRGVHGGYWALVNKDKQNCGVTIHLIDSGIDTGKVITQNIISIEESDNFITYPIHQYNLAIKMMKEVLRGILDNGDIEGCIRPDNLPSKLWYHPTITTYLYHRLLNKVK